MSGEREILWRPSRERIEKTQMFAFMRRMSERHGVKPDWPSLHEWSVRSPDLFWREMLDWAEIPLRTPPQATCAGQGMLGTKWFPGATFNFAEVLLRREDDGVAVRAEDERGRVRTLTYRRLREETARCAASLRDAGVKSGDRVAAYIPNIPEAVIAMLATASIGAVWSSCSPDFGVKGVFDRFSQIAPKVLISADGYSYNGKSIDLTDKIRGVVDQIPGIERVVIVGFLNESPDVSSIPGVKPWDVWDRFLNQSAARDRQVQGAPTPMTFEPLPFDHPLYVMYSSGTTGVPKCIVHGAGGTLLQHLKELMLHCDLRRDETIFYFTTCGWMMWNWVVSSLAVGATLALYEGSPSHPSVDHLWSMAEQAKINVFGTSPKFLTACENARVRPGADHDLSNLRCVLSTGSPLTAENFRWVYRNVKEDVQLSSISGGTDIISCFVLGNPTLPVRAGEIQCRGLGMDVHAFDDGGRSVIGQKGELVCRAPFPSQPIEFWNDPDRAKYKSAYFERYEGVWHHGDYLEITESGGAVIHGRSDATLNPGGVRIGTAEIYRLVESMEEVLDSLVVGKDVRDDVEIVLFVVLRPGLTLDDALTRRIQQRVAEGATKRHVPKHVRQVPEIPYTISGKKVELAVRRILRGQEVKNRDALANPHALDHYYNIL